MPADQISPLVIAAALSACAAESESLNSERILERFGSYGIDIIRFENGVRRSNLYSLDGKSRICRTFAVVRFHDDLAPSVTADHADVLAGQSIGATFKSNGWQIRKTTMHVGAISTSTNSHSLDKLMQLDKRNDLAMHAYSLTLEKGAQSIDYAMVVEIHHPDYLSPLELQKLFADSIELKLDDTALGELTRLALD